MKKKLLLTFLVSALVFSHIYIGTPDQMPSDEQKLGTLYIEVVKGQCLDDNGNGIILNTDSEYNYIAYGTDTNKGDKVTSIFIYNPLTTWIDDCYRFDF